MPLDIDPQEIPVLLLYNIDPSWTRDEKEEVSSISSQLSQAISAAGHPTTLVPVFNVNVPQALYPYDPTANIVFNWCEGIPGIAHSEAMVARILESMGFTFTGAGSSALAHAQDKCCVKHTLHRANIPTPEWRLYKRAEAGRWNQFPAIVKAANEHCSEGITRESVVTTEAELIRQIRFVLATYHQPALVEDFIDGREFHVSLWGNGHIAMLPPAEMDFSLFGDIHDRLCTYDSKCVPGSIHYENIRTLLPSPLSQDELQTLEHIARDAYKAMGCRDYARIDVRSRNGTFYVLDVNPNADISADASLAGAAELAGYSYGETGSRIVRLAAKRHPVWGQLA